MPNEGANGGVFILDEGSQIKLTNTLFNFPAVIFLSCIGTINLLYIVSKRQE